MDEMSLVGPMGKIASAIIAPLEIYIPSGRIAKEPLGIRLNVGEESTGLKYGL
jgi:hypothetical protein